MRTPTLGLIVASLLTMACSGSADLSGHVSVALTAGNTTRAADLEVFLLRATDALVVEWNRMVASFHADRAGALAAAQEAEEAQARARADRSSAASAWLSVLLQKDGVDWRAYDQAAERQKAAIEQILAAQRRGRDARSQLARIVSRYRSEAWDLILMHQTQRVRTDANGHFTFSGATPGQYFLASRCPRLEDDIYWFIPLEVRPRITQTTDLTIRNAGWPFS